MRTQSLNNWEDYYFQFLWASCAFLVVLQKTLPKGDIMKQCRLRSSTCVNNFGLQLFPFTILLYIFWGIQGFFKKEWLTITKPWMKRLLFSTVFIFIMNTESWIPGHGTWQQREPVFCVLGLFPDLSVKSAYIKCFPTAVFFPVFL